MAESSTPIRRVKSLLRRTSDIRSFPFQPFGGALTEGSHSSYKGMGVGPGDSGGALRSEARALREEKETLDGTDSAMTEMETMPISEDKQPITKVKKPLDNNVYSTKKTVAQGMMDIALLTANASQIKLLLKYNQDRSSIFFIHLTCICISIALQIIVGVMLIVNSRYDINRPSHQTRADLMNNFTVIGIFLITVVNVIASSFSDST